MAGLYELRVNAGTFIEVSSSSGLTWAVTRDGIIGSNLPLNDSALAVAWKKPEATCRANAAIDQVVSAEREDIRRIRSIK